MTRTTSSARLQINGICVTARSAKQAPAKVLNPFTPIHDIFDCFACSTPGLLPAWLAGHTYAVSPSTTQTQATCTTELPNGPPVHGTCLERYGPTAHATCLERPASEQHRQRMQANKHNDDSAAAIHQD